MFDAYLTLSDRELIGTLDFYVLKTTQEDLKKNEVNLTIPEVCKRAFEGDALVISTLLINSIIRKTDVTPQEIMQLREADTKNDSFSTLKILATVKQSLESEVVMIVLVPLRF